MNSLSDTGPQARPSGRRPWLIGTALVLALAVLAVLITVDGSNLGLLIGALLVMTLLLLAMAALGWHVGVRLTRQRYGELLRESRMQLQAAQQLQRDWQWASDADHHLVRWRSPQGTPASSWVGHAATETLFERFDCPGECELRSALSAQRNLDGLPARDRSGHQWLLRGVACFDGQGRFGGYVGTAEPLRASDAGEQAEQAAFGYTISHDLRAPLRVVEGFARILKEDYGPQLDPRGLDHLERVLGAAGRMQGMIDALLSLTQLSSRPLAHASVDLSRMASSILDDLARGSPDRPVEFAIEPGLTAEGDPALLRMALENLLGNAWKYSSAKPCTSIRFEAKHEAGRRVYVVADQGAGFDMRFADKLFNAFQRLHSASDFPGHGIGLASVRRIVRRHGGEVWAEGAVGEGASFYFTLA